MENNKKEIKLHLGCGKKYIPGFIHVDLDRSPKIDYYHDIATLPMFKNNTVDLIYCCHAFEYFDRVQVKKVLKEWKRVLKKGGVIRLAVPDFQNITKVYLKYKDLDHQGILGPLFGRWEVKDKKGNKNYFYHKTSYDFESLKKVLEGVGLKAVRRYDWKKTIHKDYDDYSRAYIPHMDEKGILISLNVEAIK
jgi:predicted SAM-dependent methyltransferase